MPGVREILPVAAVVLTLAGTTAGAQTVQGDPSSPAPAATTLPEVVVIGISPLPGTGIDRDKVPANVQSVTSTDLAREGSPSLLNSLTDQAGSLSKNDNLIDPFQPDIFYRGFAASPVLGTPQGLAVYQNGVRINEPFGDTVNWDLVPDLAIDRVDIISANPVYGLNALGGAVVVTMKNGFTYQDFESELAGGSFGQRSVALQYGKQSGDFAAYLAGRLFDADGWRQFSPDHVQQLYADVGAHGEALQIDLSFTGANNRLFGQGTTPEQELAAGRSLVFTNPQSNFNQLQFVTLNGSYKATDTLSIQANAYRREFHQTVVNANKTNLTACTTGNGLLCQSDGTTPLVTPSGGSIPDISGGGTLPLGEDDTETIRTVGVGGTLQATDTGQLFGHDNNLVFGASIDHSTVDFQSATEVGVFNSSLRLVPSGSFVATPEGTPFNATPVGLSATNDYYGLFITDTFNVTEALAVTASGRYNLANVNLADHEGADLTSRNQFVRFNPAVGGTYKITPGVTLYAGYSEGNRAPTPSEIECSNPARPCVLPSSLSSDPPLRQVVSHTYETGLRGNFTLPETLPGKFRWNLGLFRTDLNNDIFGVATSISTGFFENVGTTRRQGIEAGLTYRDEKWSVYGSYSLIDATFRSPLTIPSPNNPFADANGNIHVTPGDHLPGIPQHQLKVGADYRITPRWTVGSVLTYFSDQYLRGDEANRNPKLPGYAVVNLHSSYTVTENFEMFVNIQNLFDNHYNTFGAFGDPTGVGAPGIPAGAVTNGPGVDNRFVGPAPPLSVFGGIRVRF